MIRSEIGLGPWDAFHVGMHLVTGISIGLATVVTGIAIVILTLTIGVKPGIGTVANMIVIGVSIDLLLPVIPVAKGMLIGLLYYFPAILLCGFATGLYISAAMGHGPRDGLMIGLTKKTKISVSLIRTGIEMSVLLAGWLMGGKIGLGTILFAVLIGPSAQWGLKLFGMLPPKTEFL